MSSPENSGNERYEHELERLRARYARLPADEPDVLVDEAIRAAARQRTARRRTRTWSVIAGLVASIGLAAVIVPALLLEAPPDRETRLQAVAEQESAPSGAAGETAGDVARKPAAARAPEAAPALERVQVTGSRINRMDVERAELAGRDEAAWRRKILELHDAGNDALARALLDDFRARFERDEDFTLEDLRREAAAEDPADE